ncbi:hypothetical protein ACWDZ8_40575, partial [Streptomyces sp. NPDC003233]
MSNNAKIAVGGVAVGLILLIWLPWWVALLIVVGVPVAAYLALDPSQRRRLRRVTRKGRPPWCSPTTTSPPSSPRCTRAAASTTTSA